MTSFIWCHFLGNYFALVVRSRLFFSTMFSFCDLLRTPKDLSSFWFLWLKRFLWGLCLFLAATSFTFCHSSPSIITIPDLLSGLLILDPCHCAIWTSGLKCTLHSGMDFETVSGFSVAASPCGSGEVE